MRRAYLSSPSRVTNGANFPGNNVWQHVESIAIQEISTNSWYPEFLVAFITHTWLAPTWLTSVSSYPWGRADTADPKPRPKSHCRLAVWPEAPGKQRHSVRPGFSRAERSPSRRQGQRPDPFLCKIKVFTAHIKMGLGLFREIWESFCEWQFSWNLEVK